MRGSCARRRWLFAAAMLCTGALGCSQQKSLQWADVWPWAAQPDDPADLAKYGPLPKQRAADVRQLGQTMRGMSEPEKAAHARELAQRIQSERDPLVRVEMVKALGECRDPVAIAVLKAGLEDPDSDVRIACCHSWAKIGGKPAAEALGAVLGADTSAEVRIAAADALGHVNDPECTRALAVGLEDSDIAVQYRAMQSMKAVSGRDLGDDVTQWRQFAKGQTPQPSTSSDPSLAERLMPWRTK